MNRAFTVVLVACTLLTACGSPAPSGPIRDGYDWGNGILQVGGNGRWTCVNYLGEKVLNDSSHPLHPTKTMTITSIRLLDPTAVTLQGAFVFPLKIGEFITGPGLGRGWPGDLVLPQLATQDWKNPTPVVGQTLQPSDDSNAYALALKIVPDQPGTQWVYKGIVIGFTSEGKEYERRVFSSTRGAKNCDDVQEDMEGDREKYMPKPPDEKKTPSATMDLPGH